MGLKSASLLTLQVGLLVVLPLFFPWWIQSVVVFAFSLMVFSSLKRPILSTFMAVFSANLVVELFLLARSDNRLAYRISDMFHVGHPFALAIAGAILLALPAMAFSYFGTTIRVVFSQKAHPHKF